MNARLFAMLMIFITNFRICQSMRRYDHYHLYVVTPVEIDQLKFLQNLEDKKYIDVIFWSSPMKLYHDVHFLVNPKDIGIFLERVEHFNVKAKLLQENIQKAFDDQIIGKYTRLREDSYSWEFFHTLEDISQWIADLALRYANIVQLYSIGKSLEGRDIFAINIKMGNPRVKVIIDGSIHGNEWISTEFVNYLAHSLLDSNKTNAKLYKLARRYNWYLIPVLNPDGYEYSQKEDRLHSKNMRRLRDGIGVNLNRNFDYNFGKFDSSTEPSEGTFCGPRPFSEPESRALNNFVLRNSEYMKFYLSVHGYGQKFVIPYADRVNHFDDYSEMENYGKQGALKIYKLYNNKYDVGTFYDTMGLRISGNSASWVKKSFKVKYVFTFLLRDNGTYGYALPNSEILPACKEALAGLVEIMTAKPRALRANIFDSSGSIVRFGAVLLHLEIIVLLFLK